MLNRLFYYKTIIIDTMTKNSDWYNSSKMSIRLRTISPPPPPNLNKRKTWHTILWITRQHIFQLNRKLQTRKICRPYFWLSSPSQMSIRIRTIPPPPPRPYVYKQKNDANGKFCELSEKINLSTSGYSEISQCNWCIRNY